MKNNRYKNKLTLISDNPQYEPYNVNPDDILEVWKAQMVITKANTQQRWDVNQLAGLVNNLQEQVSSLEKENELSWQQLTNFLWSAFVFTIPVQPAPNLILVTRFDLRMSLSKSKEFS